MSISEVSSPTSSFPHNNNTNKIAADFPLRIQRVPNSISEKLLTKFSDFSEFGFDYSQSGLWSPPIQRSVFLSSPGKILSPSDMAAKLTKALKKHQKKNNFFNFSELCRYYYALKKHQKRAHLFNACMWSPKRFHG